MITVDSFFYDRKKSNDCCPVKEKTFFGSSIIRKRSFMLRKAPYILRKHSFILRKDSFILRKNSFMLRRPPYTLRKHSFILRKCSFILRKAPSSKNNDRCAMEPKNKPPRNAKTPLSTMDKKK